MGRVRAVDLGLSPGTKVQEIEFIEIADFPQYTVGVFLVPKVRLHHVTCTPGSCFLERGERAFRINVLQYPFDWLHEKLACVPEFLKREMIVGQYLVRVAEYQNKELPGCFRLSYQFFVTHRAANFLFMTTQA